MKAHKLTALVEKRLQTDCTNGLPMELLHSFELRLKAVK